MISQTLVMQYLRKHSGTGSQKVFIFSLWVVYEIPNLPNVILSQEK